MSVWKSFHVPEAGYVDALGEAIERVEENYPDLFWSVTEGTQIIFSDYSGQHKESKNDVYSFLVTTSEVLESWLPLRSEFRKKWLPDNRRISFKQLREPVRRRAYPHFIRAVDSLRANLITVVIDNRVGSLISGGPKALMNALDDCFDPKTPLGTVEKIYRLSMLVAMICAGLRREDQNSFWISDHDETLDSFDKRERFCWLATYPTVGLTGRLNSADQYFATTADRNLPEWVEDLAAVPDIAAGACASFADILPNFLDRKIWTTIMTPDNTMDWRAVEFFSALNGSDGLLKHVLLRLAPDSSNVIRASAQQILRRK